MIKAQSVAGPSTFDKRPDIAPTPFGRWRWLNAWGDTMPEGPSTRLIERGRGEHWGGIALCLRDDVVRLAGDGLSDCGHLLGSTASACYALNEHLKREHRVTSLSELSLGDVRQLVTGVQLPARVDVSSWCPEVDLRVWRESELSGGVGRRVRQARRVMESDALSHNVYPWPSAPDVAQVVALSRAHVAQPHNVLEQAAMRRFVDAYWSDASASKQGPSEDTAVPFVSLLKDGDKLVSGFLCIGLGNSLYYYLAGSVRRRERYGLVHLLALMDWMNATGLVVLQLLRGLERYKTDLATRIEPRFAVTWGPSPA